MIGRSTLAAAILSLLTSACPAAAQTPTCESKLQTCESNLQAAGEQVDRLLGVVGELEAEVSALGGFRVAYERLAADDDGDGTPDVADGCPETAIGLIVDHTGCSLDQFCAQTPVATGRERTRCRRLDWRNDEPERGNPRDCRLAAEAGRCASAVKEPEVQRACTRAVVTIGLLVEEPPQGVTTFLSYAPHLVLLPGSGSTVLPRVENVSGMAGLFAAVDSDADGDGTDDRLGIGLILPPGGGVPTGLLARVAFDCAPGAPRPPLAEDFACQAEASDAIGVPLTASCFASVAVEG